ncbi:MAG: hypothetical protein IPK82_04520 [Polyangiaceae bacterium]|nr:hypothetical protein [Polyangiaceae bacterium]
MTKPQESAADNKVDKPKSPHARFRSNPGALVLAVAMSASLLGIGFFIGRCTAPEAPVSTPSLPSFSPPQRWVTGPLAATGETTERPAGQTAPTLGQTPIPKGSAKVPKTGLGNAAHQGVFVRHETGVVRVTAATKVYASLNFSEAPVFTLSPNSEVEIHGGTDNAKWIHFTDSEGVLIVGFVALPLPSEKVPNRGEVKGKVRLLGTPPEMKVPVKRKDADVCRDDAVLYNAVIVNNEGLQDVFVGLWGDKLAGALTHPVEPVIVHQQSCMYTPRTQGGLTSQPLHVYNSDLTLHNVHAYGGGNSLFNLALPKHSPPLEKKLPEESTIVKLACDIHPWMRGFVVLADNPFFSTTGPQGEFSIEGVPPGTYELRTWHSQYGWKKKALVSVQANGSTQVEVDYSTSDPAPPENRDELKELY